MEYSEKELRYVDIALAEEDRVTRFFCNSQWKASWDIEKPCYALKEIRPGDP